MKKILYLSSVLIFTVSLESQWNKIPTNTATYFFTSFFINSQTGWIAGQESAGKIFYTQNGGVNWTLQLSTPYSERFESMHFINSATGWAGTYYSQVFKTTNAGLNWTSSTINGAGRIRRIYFTDNNNGWFISEGGLWKTVNGGGTWNGANLNFPGMGLYFFNQNTGLVSTFVYPVANIYRTTNAGINWNSVYYSYPGSSINSFDFVNQYTGFAVGYKKIVLKTTNSGYNWLFIRIDSSTIVFNDFRSVDFIDYLLGYACGQYIIPGPTTYYGAVFNKTTDGGLTWFQPTTNPNMYGIYSFEDVKITDGQIGYVSGSEGIVYKSTNAGYIGIQPISSEIPDKFSLSQNYPNPFNPVTKIKFEIPNSKFETNSKTETNLKTEIRIYNILGREIKILVNEQLNPGTYEVEFDGTDLPSGVYFYKLNAGDFTQSKKMILLK